MSHRGRAQEANQALEQACLARYGLVYPRGEQRAQLRSDNGRVFMSKHFQTCCKQYGLSQEFITPYTPQQNGMIERLFRSLKEECIGQHHFKTFEQAKAAIEAWVRFYNSERPHQALNYRSRRSTAPLNNYPKRLGTRGGTTRDRVARLMRSAQLQWLMQVKKFASCQRGSI